MNFVIFGLTISSSWGNGHATLWRGLVRALTARGHRVRFFERDMPYYRSNRDLWQLADDGLVLYDSWQQIESRARAEIAASDAAIVTSYCPDGAVAAERLLDGARGAKIFYDLDTPVTLAALEHQQPPAYLPARGLADFDLVLSFTGGRALQGLRDRLGARRAAALYGHADPEQHCASPPDERYRGALSYLGTYAEDRQQAVGELLFAPAERRPEDEFVVGGSQYPADLTWPANVRRVSHVPPQEHGRFFCSSRLTLNVTRGVMARFGYCPSGRLFEAAACGARIVSDWFEGLDQFFDPWHEVIVVRSREDVMHALSLSERELEQRAQRTRERVLACHTAMQRAQELEALIWSSPSQPVVEVPPRPGCQASC